MSYRRKKKHSALRTFFTVLIVILLIGAGVLAAFRYVKPLKQAITRTIVKQAAQEAIVSSGGYVSEEQVQQALDSMSEEDQEKLETIIDDHSDPQTVTTIGSYVASGDYNSAYDYAKEKLSPEELQELQGLYEKYAGTLSGATGE